MKFLLALILTGFGFSSISEAGCDSFTAPRAVSGHTYSARNHPLYPKLLTFYEDGSASFGSALDGHPGGVFSYEGACMDRILVSFTTMMGPEPGPTRTVFLLYPQDSFHVLVDKATGQKFYRELRH